MSQETLFIPARRPVHRASDLQPVIRYGTALLAIACAVAARAVLDPWLGSQLPYVTFLVAIAAIALVAGPGPTFLGIELGYLAAVFFFVEPRRTLVLRWDGDDVQSIGYFVVSAAIFGLSELRSRWQHRAEQVAAALLSSQQQLELESRRKDEFIAVLSHELRNPLAPIRHGVALLRRAVPGSREAGRVLAAVDRQSAHLARLVEGLLDANRIAHGGIPLRIARLDLREVVRATVEDHRALLRDRGLEVWIELPDRPFWIDGDEVRLAQALGNLLENAGKFTPPGGRVTVALGADGPGAARLTVRDTGPGIDPAVRTRLFQAFAQAEMTLARSEGGLGLGLALVKAVCVAHGGSVGARSGGPGAELVLALPLVAIGPTDPAAPLHDDTAPDDPGAGRARARRVVIIEDNEDAADTLREVLEMDGHEVHVAVTGPEGVALVGQVRPDAIFCDIGLPGMDGYAVARELRRQGIAAGAMLVALTGYASSEDARRAAEAGFDHHLAKPADLDAIARLVAGSAPAEPH